jgi:beta-glucanase (GH16 family)
MKKRILGFFLTLLLSSCGKEEELSDEIRYPQSHSESRNKKLVNKCKSPSTFPPKLELFESSSMKGLFHSAEVVSKQVFIYGKFVARIKPIHVRGVVSAFFLYDSDLAEEFDVEILGGHELSVPTLHPCRRFKELPLSSQIMDEFHEYAMEWTPESIRWLLDDKLVFEVELEGYSMPKHIILSTNIADTWDGPVDLKTWKDQRVSYSSVRYYPYLPDTGTFSNTPSWSDVFIDSIEERWFQTTLGTYNKANIRQNTVDGIGRLDLWLTKIL